MKKLLYLLLLTILFLTGCTEKKDLYIIKEEVVGIINSYDENIECNDISIIGEYDEIYIVSIYRSMVIEEGINRTFINEVEIKYDNHYEILCYYNNFLYTLNYCFDKGWLIEEDIIAIKEVLENCNYEPNKDIENSSNLHRCKHSTSIISIVDSSCNQKGLDVIKCNKCKKELRKIEKDYLPHNYENSVCTICGENKYLIIERNNEFENQIKNKLLGYEILDCFGSYKYNNKEIRVYYLSNYSSESKVSISYEFLGDLMIALLSDTKIVVFQEETLYNLEDAYNKKVINKNICLEVFNQYLEKNICNKELSERYNDLQVKDYDKLFYMNCVFSMSQLYKSKLIYLQTYYLSFPFSELNNITGYYLGNYNDVSVIYIQKDYKYFCNYNKQSSIHTIENYQFKCLKNYELVVIYQDKVISISEAYMQKYLTINQIKNVYKAFNYYNVR